MPSPPLRSTDRHVCFVAPFGLGQKTTVWARTLPLARVLVTLGWQGTILLPPWDTPADAGKQWQDNGVEVVNVATTGGTAAITGRLLREISRRAPQIVTIIKPRAHAGLVQWCLWQRRRWPNAARPRLMLDVDDWEQAWAPINRYPPIVTHFLAWQEEWGLRHADGITAASRWLEQRAGFYNPAAPILYLPNGVTPPAPATPHWACSGAGDVLFFTRFVEVDATWLAEFWQSLSALRPSARLLMAGQPVQAGLDTPFRTRLAQLSAGGAVEWLGFVPPETLPALFARTGCAIFPAAAVPLQQAKCSVRLATTLLQGVPVVASAVGEQAAYGADGAARLVPAAASPAEFATAVAAVLQNPQAQTTLGANARARLIERYDWTRLGQQLSDFYTNILGM